MKETQRVNMNLPVVLMKLVEQEVKNTFVADRTQLFINMLAERYKEQLNELKK